MKLVYRLIKALRRNKKSKTDWIKANPILLREDTRENCLTCKHHKTDKGILRCEVFDNAIIDDPKEKQCEDSIHPGYEKSNLVGVKV